MIIDEIKLSNERQINIIVGFYSNLSDAAIQNVLVVFIMNHELSQGILNVK